MKVLYDHQIFTQQTYGGISRYFCELMDQFSQRADINFTLALRISYNENLCNRLALNQYWSNRNRLLSCIQIIPHVQKIIHLNLQKRLFNNQSESERLLKKQDYDIFHPTYYNPYFLKHLQEKPYVLTVHDMIHELYPEYYSSHDPTTQWKKELIEHADSIIAVSESTKKDILKFTNVESDRISVIYHGNPFEFHIKSNKTTIRSDPHSGEKPYLLFVGNRTDYKNFIFFITAISNLIKKEKDLMVYCTGGGPFTADEQKILVEQGIQPSVHMVNMNDHTLPQLYANARAFVFPSLYEGFGLPVLEAFSCGCPVIASNTSSLPEIASDAACYFNADDADSIVQGIESVLSDPIYRENLIKKGYDRLKFFSWKKTALETKQVYTNLYENRY
jgi:glycosyltransferase involved in cell wall biosynthesis